MLKIQSLQILRALAAIQVLITHVFQRLNYKPFGDYFLSGQYGVDIFFILSGFLIFITTKNTTQPFDYLKKRLFRIYPLYIFAVLLYILVFYFTGIEDHHLTVIKFAQNILMIPWDSSIGYKSLIVAVAWSTVFEMFFYTIFFFILLSKIPKKWILILIPSIMAVGSAVHYVRLVPDNTPFLSLFLSLFRSSNLLFFFSGCLIGYVVENNKLPKVKNIKIYAVVFLMTLAATLVMIVLPRSFFISLTLMSLLFVLLVYYESMFVLKQTYVIRKLIYFGDISYSIYLIHILVILVIIKYFDINNLVMVLILSIICTLFLSSLTYQYIEKPFIAFAKKSK